MFRTKALHISAVVLSLAAATISYNLLLKHLTGAPGPAWFQAGCSDSPVSGGPNCAAVLASPHSYFPAKTSDVPDGRPHIPVAFLGLGYYSALVVWLLAIGRPSPSRRWIHLLPLLFVAGGLAGSIYYLRIMFTVLSEWCSWCLVTHVLNLLIVVFMVLLWPRRTPSAVRASSASSSGDEARSAGTTEKSDPRDTGRYGVLDAAHPSTSLVLVTLGTILVLLFAEFSALGLKTWKMRADAYAAAMNTCKAEYELVTADGAKFLEDWRSADRHPVTVRADESGRSAQGSNRPSLAIVVFSDFECPSCKGFAHFAQESIHPLFGNDVAIRFKHYPLDAACNHRTATRKHPHACMGARMAEAARTLGGLDGFQRAHDYLFANQGALKRGLLSPTRVATALQLDTQAFINAMQDDTTNERIFEDVDLAKACSVNGTPAVFVDGRRVGRGALTNVAFWQKLASEVAGGMKRVQPQVGLRPVGEPTPDNPDRRDAP